MGGGVGLVSKGADVRLFYNPCKVGAKKEQTESASAAKCFFRPQCISMNTPLRMRDMSGAIQRRSAERLSRVIAIESEHLSRN